MLPIDIAERYLAAGAKEATGKNDGPTIRRFLREDAQLNWCSAFVLTCFDEAGAPLPGNFYANRAVKTLETELRGAGAEIAREALRRGDIVTFERRGGAHVGIVAEVIPDVRAFFSVEGNVSNRVKRVPHALTVIQSAFRWPVT